MIPLPVVIEQEDKQRVAYDLFSRLLKDRIIFIGTPINDTVANAVIAQLLFLESQDPDKDVYMYINSPGGVVTSGLGIYDTMQYVKPDIVTVCVGQAASMGCHLLAGGAKEKRFALPHARIMMHPVSGGMRGSSLDVEIEYEEMMSLQSTLHSLLATHCGRTVDEVRKEFQRNRYMSPNDAVEFGIIDSIHERSVRESNE